MNRLENIIVTIVTLFVVIILFAFIYGPLVDIVGTVNSLVNDTGGNYTTISGHNNRIPGYFGFIMVCFAIAVLIGYFMNAHRKEHEEFEEYRYR